MVGNNEYGQLGIGNNQNQNTLQKVEIPDNKKVLNVILGYTHTAFLMCDGSVYMQETMNMVN